MPDGITLSRDNLCGWLYVSECALPPAWAERGVEAIVETSIARNSRLGVTGALLFTGRNFVQFIEGPSAGLAELRAAIEADTRHRDVDTKLFGVRHSRMFESWSLAYAGRSVFIAENVSLLAAAVPCDTDALIAILREFAQQVAPSI